MKNETSTRDAQKESSETNVKRPFYVILRDAACNTYSEGVVMATSREEAQRQAVMILNKEMDYGPDDDGGIEPLFSFNTEELQAVVDHMRRMTGQE